MTAGGIADLILDWATTASVLVSLYVVWHNRKTLRRIEQRGRREAQAISRIERDVEEEAETQNG